MRAMTSSPYHRVAQKHVFSGGPHALERLNFVREVALVDKYEHVGYLNLKIFGNTETVRTILFNITWYFKISNYSSQY